LRTDCYERRRSNEHSITPNGSKFLIKGFVGRHTISIRRRRAYLLPPLPRGVMTVPLTAVEYGEGPPLAILHGLFGSGRNWTSIAQRLAKQHRVVTLDLRNHG